MARRAGKGSCHSSTFGFDRRPCTCSFHGHHLWLLSSSLPLLVPWGALERDHVRAPAPAPPSSCSSPQPCPSLLLSPSRFLSPRVSSLASSEAVTGKAVGPDGMRVLAPALKTRPTLQSLKYARG